MKTNILFFLALTIMLFSSCRTPRFAVPVPKCVENKINDIESKPVQNPPTQVWQWKVDGQTYYYFTAPCCDQFTTLYDESCNKVCSPDGGFTGRGDGKCPDFKTKVEKTLVWEDKR